MGEKNHGFAFPFEFSSSREERITKRGRKERRSVCVCVRERERESALFSFSAVLYPRTADEVGLGGLLEGQDGRRLEAQVGLEVLGDLADQALVSRYSSRLWRLSLL